jgi:sugar O-acyltransferase (sialic acid O-acetyltransferase NeuD family)
MKQILIVGAGGTGQDVAGFIADINDEGPTYECLGFLDDDTAKHGTEICGYPVLGPLSSAAEYDGVAFANCLGSPRSFLRREQCVRELGINDESFETIIHPTAIVADGCTIGRGCILYPFTHLGPGVGLEQQVVVLSHTVIHHHSHVGRFAIIASGCNISGGVRIGASCYLGTGCSIRDDVRVGERSLVGMGSAVTEDVQPGTVVAGVPVRFIRDSV